MSYQCNICNIKYKTKLENDIHINTQEHIDNVNIFIQKMSCVSISNKKIQMSLVHELTQFTKGKTEQTLKQITTRYLINSENYEEHLIDIIITNKSLAETEQWKIRTSDKFKNDKTIQVDILSSKKDSEYNNIKSYIADIVSAKSKKDLPNILVICFHKTRVVDDLMMLFDTFSGTKFILPFTNIKFHLNFDEPDANLGVTSTFLKGIKEKYNHIITGIVFITASPYDDFWKMLHKNKILELYNIHHTDEFEEKTYDDYLEDYRSISEHKHTCLDNNTENPLEYIKLVFTNNLIDNKKINIIFAPAHVYTTKEDVGSHKEVVEYFKSLGYHVFLSNGTFKGFITNKGIRESLVDFNIKYKIQGELRESLRKWKQLNPKQSLAITGYNTIERGVTFNTDDFNMTHAIISNYHSKKDNKLIQVIGRTTGHKKYVDKMIIICPQDVYDKVISLVEKTIRIRELNPENYEKTDFTERKEDNLLLEECGIPIILKLNLEDVNKINEFKKLSDRNRIEIKNIIEKSHLINYNNNFNIKDYYLRNKYLILKDDVDQHGKSKYEYRNFLEYHNKKKKKIPNKNCNNGEFLIYIIVDDIKIWNAEKGDAVILYKNKGDEYILDDIKEEPKIDSIKEIQLHEEINEDNNIINDLDKKKNDTMIDFLRKHIKELKKDKIVNKEKIQENKRKLNKLLLKTVI
jgi:hypothetical protein